MLQSQVLTTEESPPKRGPGRLPHYGEKTIKRPVYYPPALLEKLKSEAAWRGAKAGDPDEWNVSRVVVDILLDHFGMEKPAPAKNGRKDD